MQVMTSRGGDFAEPPKENKRRKRGEVFWNKKRKTLLFYTLMIALPVLQVCVFYVGVNFNSILLAFEEYDYTSRTLKFAWLENFRLVFTAYDGRATTELLYGIRNSVIIYGVSLLTSLLLVLPVSNAIYKNVPLSGFFKVLLYLPSVLSVVVMGVIYRNFTDWAWPDILTDLLGADNPLGPLSSGDAQSIFWALILFQVVFTGFGNGLLLYTGAMSGISESVIDAAKIDGANAFQEFFHITVPAIWPTFSTLVVVGIAGVFTNQFNLYTFYGDNADYKVSTIGYYLYKLTYRATQSTTPYGDTGYTYLAAFGIVLTLIAAPLTLGMKRLLAKVGPRTD